MSAVTRFAGRDPGPAARLAGFMAHLRANGLRLGVSDTEAALMALTEVRAADWEETRLALRAICTGTAEEAARFDALFDAFWRDGGRVRRRVGSGAAAASPHVHGAGRAPGPGRDDATGRPDGAEDGARDGTAEAGGEGRLIATGVEAIAGADLRRLVTPEDIAAAETVARRLGAALRDRRSRRRRAARRGAELDFRRLLRRALARGGLALDLPRRTRPDRSVRLVALCDVSGSMTVHARVFLAFLAGLMRADPRADGYLFHTRLVRITDALREPDPLKAMARLSLMADGFGGGSRIGAALERFAAGPAKSAVTGRSVVLVLSDGYDTDPPERLAAALAAIRRRGARLVWLNPLIGHAGYAPVAAGMAAALPHLDRLLACRTLADLSALEPEFARL